MTVRLPHNFKSLSNKAKIQVAFKAFLEITLKQFDYENSEDYPDELKGILVSFDTVLNELYFQLYAGNITLDEFKEAMEQAIARSMGASFMTGKGSVDVNDAQGDYIAQEVAKQYSFLGGLIAAIAIAQLYPKTTVDAAGNRISENPIAKFQNRIRSYVDSIVQAFHRGKYWGIPLPAIPGDGTSTCLTHCRCHWEIDYLDSKNGDFDCYWRLGVAEHCFPVGTKIITEAGDIPIEKIAVGTKVLTRFGYKKVTKLFKHFNDKGLISVQYKGHLIECTPNHPILTQRGWVRADKLQASDTLVLSEDFRNISKVHIDFPYSNDFISASRKIGILRSISSLLFKLPFGKREESLMPMPVIPVCLDNKPTNLNVHNKMFLDNKLGYINNSKRIENFHKFNFQATRRFFVRALEIVSMFIIAFLNLFGMILPIRKHLVFTGFIVHWVSVKHALSRFRINNSFCRGFRKFEMQLVRFISNFKWVYAKRFPYNITTILAVMVNKIFNVLIRPENILRGWLGFNFAFADCSIPTQDTAIHLSRRLIVGKQFSTKLASGFVFNNKAHNLIITSIKRDCIVYNLEIEDVHEYIAGGIVVHNCQTCKERAKDWKPLRIREFEIINPFVTTTERKYQEIDNLGSALLGNMLIAQGLIETKGGEGSGHHGHAGRPGKLGGSAPKGAGIIGEDSPKYGGLSDNQRESLQSMLLREIDYGSGDFDNLFVKREDRDAGYEYSYWSYNRPFDRMWGKLSQDYFKQSPNQRMIFTKEPLTLDDMLKYELAPSGTETKADVIEKYYETVFGRKDVLVLGQKTNADDAILHGIVITRSARYPGSWQGTMFDANGFWGDTIRDTKLGAIEEAVKDHYLIIREPEFLDRISKHWKPLKKVKEILSMLKGGEGSGHHGHAGRPGKLGGSAPKGGGIIGEESPKYSTEESFTTVNGYRPEIMDAYLKHANALYPDRSTEDALEEWASKPIEQAIFLTEDNKILGVATGEKDHVEPGEILRGLSEKHPGSKFCHNHPMNESYKDYQDDRGDSGLSWGDINFGIGYRMSEVVSITDRGYCRMIIDQSIKNASDKQLGAMLSSANNINNYAFHLALTKLLRGDGLERSAAAIQSQTNILYERLLSIEFKGKISFEHGFWDKNHKLNKFDKAALNFDFGDLFAPSNPEQWEIDLDAKTKLTTKGGEGSGHFEHRGIPGQVGGSLPGNMGASALDEMYAGLPSVGGYGHHSEYEVAHGRYAEAGHCILGSLSKIHSSNYDRMRKKVEEGHIREELGIMKETLTEYSRALYLDPENHDKEAADSIAEASEKLHTILRETRAKIGKIPGKYKRLAIDTIDAIDTMALLSLNRREISGFNVFQKLDLIFATQRVEEAVNALYGLVR